MKPSNYAFKIWNEIRRKISDNSEFRGKEDKIEKTYDNLANIIRHDQCLLEFKRRFCHGKLGYIFQIPDYDNPTPEQKTDAILTNDRNKLGVLTLGNKNYKLQMKYKSPTTWFSIGIKRNDLKEYEKNNIALLIGIDKTSDSTYYLTTKSINTKEHHYFLWIPNHPLYKNFKYVDKPDQSYIYLYLDELRNILNFELLENNQSVLNNFLEAL